MKFGYLMQAGAPDVRQYPLSGPANHVKHVFNELINLGHEVRLLAYLSGQIWKSDNLNDFEPVSVRWLSKGPLRLLERAIRRIQAELQLPYAALFDSLRFAQACYQELADCDLLYERMGWVGYGGSIAARWLKIPLILEVNGDHLTEFEALGVAPRGMQRWLSITLMNRMIRRVDHVVPTGDGWRQRFIEQWDVDPENVTTIENGSELVNLLKREQLRSFQDSNNLTKPTTLAFIGSFDPWQGITVLLRALAQAVQQGTCARLILIGSGSKKDELEQLAWELNIRDCITFADRLPPHEFALHLANADIAVSPYCGRAEFSGLKLLDYKAAGLPTIASGQNGQPAILEHGRTGWIVPPCEEKALSEAIIRLATDAELRKRIGREARLEAETYHSWQHTAEQLTQVFKQVVTR